MFPRIRLHIILFLLFTLISSVPVLILAGWVEESALSKEVAAVKEKHLQVARNLTGDLSRYATDVESAFRLVARNLIKGEIVEGFPELLETLYFQHISVITADGTVEYITTPTNQEAKSHIAPTLLETLHPLLQQAATKPNTIIFSDLVRDTNGEPTLFVVQSISNNHFVIGALSTRHFIEVQKTVSFGRRGHAAIVDRTGRAIAHPVAEWRENMKDMSFLPPVAKMMQGKTGVSQFFTPAMQADMVAGYTTVPRFGWGVMIPQPFEELEERAKDVQLVALAITLLGICIAGVISWYLAGILARPIQAVVDSARSVLEGNPISRVTTSQGFIPPELRELMSSFNQMVDEIRNKNAIMEETATRLAEAQRIAHIGNWEWDMEQNKLWCSDEVYKICDTDPANFQANYQSILNLIHPDDLQLFQSSINKTLQEGEPFSIEHRILLSDGSERFVHHEGEVQAATDGSRKRLMGIIYDITERKRYEDQLIKQANYDELTGLPNRTLFLDRLTQTLLKAKRNRQLVGLLYIDLDHFKVVNDTHGHVTGDHLLQQAAKRLRTCLRQSDTLARLGGDEFTVILENINSEEDAALVADKIIASLKKSFLVDGYEAFIGASVGITIYPNDTDDPVTMLRNADIALFRAKEMGRSTFCFFTQNMDQEVLNRVNLANDLRRAVEQDELSVYYQPIVDLNTGNIVYAEALVRWFHPQRGAVPPDLFIPLAEETGVIGPLGEWVMQEACEQAALWQKMVSDSPRVSVNLSVRQLKLGLTKEKIIQILDNAGLPTNRLSFEITESMIMKDTDESINWMKSIRELGVHFSVDDFGTGYSSLSYLKRLPVDVLKIDRSFIKDMMDDSDDASLVKTIIAIGQSLRLKVVAEGVEDVHQINFLHELKCDTVQGYHYSKPIPANEFAEFLETWDSNKARPDCIGDYGQYQVSSAVAK
jgi:diguanylate cyclase (GGDEF)-like protein